MGGGDVTAKPLSEQLQQVKKDAQHFIENIDAHLEKIPFLKQIETTTKVPKKYLVLGILLVLTTTVFVMFGTGAIIDSVGFLYPVYASFKAVKSSSKDDDTQWLMYWIIYGFFAVFEKFADLALGWLPLYFFFKLGFLVYCFLPQTKGALFIFNHVIDPILSKYEAQIDTGLKTLGAAAAKKIE